MPDKAVIWDMDGVIADTAPFHFEAWRAICERRGRQFTHEDFQRGFGLRNDAILTGLFGELSPTEIEVLSRQKEKAFRTRIAGHIRPLPGVRSMLHSLSGLGFDMALVSSAPMGNIKLVLSSLDIEGYFRYLISGRDVSRGKPAPDGFLLAAHKLGVEPRCCVVIEDAIAGVEAAKSAGMKCIAVTTTHDRTALAGADLVTDDLGQVTARDVELILACG